MKVALENRVNFLKLFEKKMADSTHELIKTFIIDVNGKQGQINREDLAKWCGNHLNEEEKHRIYYDESIKYPAYSPAYSAGENSYHPYLSEGIGVEIFKVLGYIS